MPTNGAGANDGFVEARDHAPRAPDESRLSEVPSVYADARVNGSSRRCFVEAEARANPEI